jgi:hypothetical protein
MISLVYTPPALICTRTQDDVDLKGMPLTSLHKETLAALKKEGYKRTRVEEDDLVLVGSATEVDLLSPDGKEKISLVLYTEDDSTVERETLVPESKADAYARYRPLLKEKFPNVQLTCYEYGKKTYAGVQLELSEATPKSVMEAIAETKKAIALIEANRGSDLAPAPMPSDPLGATLKDAKLIYSDIGSFYKLKYDYSDNKRSQVAYIRKEIYTYNSLKVQEIFSLCYDKPEPPSAELLQSAFQKRYTVGGLVLEAPSEKQTNWRIRFRTSVATNVLPQTLKEYMLLVAGTADNLEKELNPNQEDKL